jgi:diacylglycerol O-acyltransferase / wax synthase
MSRERLSSMDTLMLRVDNPASVSMVTGLMVFGTPIPRERLKEVVESRFLRFDRFRQRMVAPGQPWRAPYWEDAPDIDFDYHLKEVALPPPGDRAALWELIARLSATPLDPAHPLWQMHLVEPCAGGCAMICRVHHSVADGVALAHVVLSMTDGDPSDPTFTSGQATGEYAPELRQPVRVKTRRQAARKLAARGLDTLAGLPSGPDLLQTGVDAATDLSDLLLSPADTATVLRGAPSVAKRVACSDPIPLDEIKLIGRRLGGTVNDILLTATAGALRDYLLARGTSLDGAGLRALVPVSLRRPGAEMELGNRIGVLFLPLPVELADPAERLAELKWRMDNHKGSYQAPILNTAMRAGGRLPAKPLSLAVDYLCTKASVVVTNVRGPTGRCALAGAPLDELMFWIPRYGGIGVAVTILSYAGQVRVGVISDRDTVSDPETVLADFHDEIDVLLAQTAAAEPPAPGPSLASQLDRALADLDEILADGRPRQP